MSYYPSPSFVTVLFTALSAIVLNSSQALAQASPEEHPPLVSGVYSRGVQQIHIVHGDGNICIQGVFDAEVQDRVTAAIEQIRQETSEAETDIQARLEQEATAQKERIQALIQDESQLNMAVESSQLTPEQVQQLRWFSGNPQSLDMFLEEQANEANQQLRTRIEQERIEAEEKVNVAAGNLIIQGVASLGQEYQAINTYTVNETAFIILPQESGSLVFGEPDKLQEFQLSENVALQDEPDLQHCLESQQPYNRLTMP